VDPAVFSMLMHPDDFAIGSAETVAERLIEQCRAGGFGRLVAFADFGGFTPQDLAHSHELIGTKVAPILRSAEVRGGKRESNVNADEFSSAHASGIAHGRHVRSN
ncbi:MAG: hypothetical protein J2P55_14980, partial [Rhizobiales bacterium]|nr:hypothetical protein [Hyphomicrobiales bacterium]